MHKYGILKKTACGPPEWVGWVDRVHEVVGSSEESPGRRTPEYFIRDFSLRRIVASTHDLQN